MQRRQTQNTHGRGGAGLGQHGRGACQPIRSRLASCTAVGHHVFRNGVEDTVLMAIDGINAKGGVLDAEADLWWWTPPQLAAVCREDRSC